MEHMEPTTSQVVLFSRLQTQHGHTLEWERLMKGRRFERMTPHRAFHFIQLLIRVFEGRVTRSVCGCDQRWLREGQGHPAGEPGAFDALRV